ncbi:component of the Tol biopolymer transport system [Granulicella pectinivorans]|uniref:Component of the Tol biopolymer transport system n=1 Tax=Granulicella pectinivorans TaxID=474950 RepID=A0A1I6L8L7_9BACT|nr:amidohydrolase family protein [Granulicella pectinivorans]SFR99819.1 component of the Tol biopolymer transport system [Granulicella pectinivorans]
MRFASVLPLALSSVALMAAPPTPAVTPHKVITVHEGTNMAVTVSPDHRTILMDLQGMIYAIPFAGGAAKRVTGPLVEASHPEYSPDGKWVAIQSYAGGTFHIWVMRPDGTGLKQMTTGHGDDREPRFSPDGKTIAFSSDRANKGSYDIWTVDVASGAVKQITSSENDEYEPAWSPDGSSLAYVNGVFVAGAPGVGGVVGRTVESVDLATGATKTVASIGRQVGRIESPSWSPDGKHLAYIQFMGAGMFVDAARLVVDGKPVAGGGVKDDDAFPFPPVWLSDASILYTANGAILKVDLGAGTKTAIPFTAGIESIRPVYKGKDFGFNATATRQALGLFSPALSPDGKKAAFVALNQLYLLTVGNPVPKALTHDTYYKQGPAWSPDGKTLAYVSDKDGVENIYLMDVATGTDKRAAASMDAQIFPAWSPDGRWMAFQKQDGATMLLELSSGAISPLAPATFFPGRPAFSPDGKTVAIATVKPYSKRFREGTSSILTVDLATKKTTWYDPAPFESITTRTEDGPVYSPKGEIAFIMDDLLYAMPVDAMGKPDGAAVALNGETSDAPTYNGDGSKILYVSNGKLRLLDRKTKAITPVPVTLTYKPLQPKPTDKVLIHAGKFWKGEGAETLTDVDVLVVGNRVASVKPHGGPVPAGAMVIEAPHSTLLPGLWENHAHPNSDNSIYYGDRMGRLWMVYGITTLRDMADQAYRAVEEKESFVSGAAVGPRLFATGEAIDGERTYYPMMIPTTSEAQLHREFERLHALDFDFMKLYVRLPYTWIVEGVKYAHGTMGVQTAGHYLLPAVDLGNDGMSHVSATARTGYAYSRSLTGASYSDVRQLMAESGMWTTSTLLNQGVIAQMPEMADDTRYNLAPPWEKKRLIAARDAAMKSDQTANEDRVMKEEATLRGVLERKGMYIGGTDSPLDLPSTSLHLNILSQVKFGLAPWQALETVTSTAARAAKVDKDLGLIAPGYLADMILVEGDPLVNIKDVTKVQCVMKNGAIHSVGELMAPFVKSDVGVGMCPAK